MASIDKIRAAAICVDISFTNISDVGRCGDGECDCTCTRLKSLAGKRDVFHTFCFGSFGAFVLLLLLLLLFLLLLMLPSSLPNLISKCLDPLFALLVPMVEEGIIKDEDRGICWKRKSMQTTVTFSLSSINPRCCGGDRYLVSSLDAFIGIVGKAIASDLASSFAEVVV